MKFEVDAIEVDTSNGEQLTKTRLFIYSGVRSVHCAECYEFSVAVSPFDCSIVLRMRIENVYFLCAITVRVLIHPSSW